MFKIQLKVRQQKAYFFNIYRVFVEVLMNAGNVFSEASTEIQILIVAPSIHLTRIFLTQVSAVCK